MVSSPNTLSGQFLRNLKRIISSSTVYPANPTCSSHSPHPIYFGQDSIPHVLTNGKVLVKR